MDKRLTSKMNFLKDVVANNPKFYAFLGSVEEGLALPVKRKDVMYALQLASLVEYFTLPHHPGRVYILAFTKL